MQNSTTKPSVAFKSAFNSILGPLIVQNCH